jgi:TolB-like protein/DNA-binding winged helix-turn-helix (wHTH) protein
MRYYFGPYVVDVAAHELRRDGKAVKIQARVFSLLVHLVEHRDRMVDKDELQGAVWPGRVVTQAALTRAVMKARQAVGDEASEQSIIKTLHGHGYRFVAKIEKIETDASRSNETREPGPASIASGRRSGSVRIILIRWAPPLLALILVAVLWHLSRVTATPDSIPARPNSIAVLPFVNVSDDPANEYFSDGISEELLNLLAKVPELRVASRSSSFSFKGENLPLPMIASRLNVAYVLSGSVRKAGDTVRVTAQLVDVNTDSHLWSETYDRKLDDIFAIQDNIAGSVVGQLKLTLLEETPTVRKTDLDAYTLYLQARHLGSLFTKEAFEHSNRLYQEALAIDPGYAEAWSGLAGNFINQANTGQGPITEGIALAREAAVRSLEIDPDQATAYAHLSIIALRYDLDLEAAAGYLEHALMLAPYDLDILRQGATMARSLGHLDDAIAVNEFVADSDPINPVNHYFLGVSYLWAGRLDEAVPSFRQALLLSPDHVSVHYRIGVALYLKGELEAALSEMMQERGATKRLMGLSLINHELGRTEASDAALAELIARHERTTSYNIAYVCALRGEATEAFNWLEKAVRYHDTGLPQIVYQPEFERIREDPRWLPFLESVGMAPSQLEAIEFKVRLPLP